MPVDGAADSADIPPPPPPPTDSAAEAKAQDLDGNEPASADLTPSSGASNLEGPSDGVAADKFDDLDRETDGPDEFDDGSGSNGPSDRDTADKLDDLDRETDEPDEANPLGESDQVTEADNASSVEADSAQAADSGDAMPPSDGSRDDRSTQDATEHKAAALNDEPSLNEDDEIPRQPDDEGSHADSEIPDRQPGDADHHESDHLDEIPDRTAAPDVSRTPERLAEERLGEEDPAREELPPEAEQGEADTVADPLETQSAEPVSADTDLDRTDQNPVRGDDEKTVDNNEIANHAEPTDTDISDPATDALGIGEPATEPSSEAADGSAARDVTEELAETIISAAEMLLEGAETISSAAGAFFDGPAVTPAETPTETTPDIPAQSIPGAALVDGGARGGQGGDAREEADTTGQAGPGTEHGDVPSGTGSDEGNAPSESTAHSRTDAVGSGANDDGESDPAGDGDPVDPGDSNNGPDDDGAPVREGEESARDRTPDGDRQERPDVDENRQDDHSSHRRDGSDDDDGGSGTDADSVDGLSDDEIELDVARADRNRTAAELAAELGTAMSRFDGLPLASLIKEAMNHGPYFEALAIRLKNWFGR
ncbi:hypothetical protein Ga0074812_103265 [Parafrankia irregularis]|uniref:Uncharacterized protein n=1 Tax=Parafrankia irregularis TaxID=795642 RepID=A0A0S4QH35_9ACTN|nr:hypothetical protein [Parafrankia irregularis]CUU54775.1 hypothetical protein Ga0074812_103265 [Parafrankia irregularis]